MTRWLTWLVLLGLLVALGGCSRQAPESASQGQRSDSALARADQERVSASAGGKTAAQTGEPRFIKPSDLTPAERRWGVSPTRNSKITYQPDVLIIENGSDAIRGLSNDGLTWKVDAASVPANEITRGKVIFLTSRAVGRVLDVHREGNNLSILLGPVELTDVIHDCDIKFEQPANFGDALTYSLSDLPGRTADVPPIAWNNSYDERSQYLRPVQTGAIDPYLTNTISELGTLGVRLKGDKGGVKLGGDAAFHLLNPRVYFYLVINKGQLQAAELRLYGAVGFNVTFMAVSEQTGSHGLNNHVQVPTDISLPVGGPFPITVTVRQQFIVNVGFGAPGVLQAKGDYEFGGAISLKYTKPKFDIEKPEHFHGQETLLNSTEGVSLVPAYVSLTHQVKVIGGFGAFNFVVGPYVYLNTNANVTRSGELDQLARCHFSGFNMLVGTGIGYVIPQPVVSFINSILSALNLGQIKGEGGFSGPRADVMHSNDVEPKSPVCTNALKNGPPSQATPRQ